jgi:hypothetical protein
MSLRGLSPRFWVAAVLVAFVVLVGLIGPLIVSTSPDATVGGTIRQAAMLRPLSSLVPTMRARAYLQSGLRHPDLADHRPAGRPHWNRDRPGGRSSCRLPRRLGRRCAERHCERRPGHPGASDHHLGFGVTAETQSLHPGSCDRIYCLVLGGSRSTRTIQQHPNPRTHRRGKALRSRILVNPAPRRACLTCSRMSSWRASCRSPAPSCSSPH